MQREQARSSRAVRTGAAPGHLGSGKRLHPKCQDHPALARPKPAASLSATGQNWARRREKAEAEKRKGTFSNNSQMQDTGWPRGGPRPTRGSQTQTRGTACRPESAGARSGKGPTEKGEGSAGAGGAPDGTDLCKGSGAVERRGCPGVVTGSLRTTESRVSTAATALRSLPL